MKRNVAFPILVLFVFLALLAIFRIVGYAVSP
jgi:hypothetical protein